MSIVGSKYINYLLRSVFQFILLIWFDYLDTGYGMLNSVAFNANEPVQAVCSIFISAY